MKQEDQLIALLEWLGWKRDSNWRSGWVMPPDRDGMCLPSNIPPLTLDLMHEAEKRIDGKKQNGIGQTDWDRYLHVLVVITGNYIPVSATKEQRLESLLKTIGKYIEPPKP